MRDVGLITSVDQLLKLKGTHFHVYEVHFYHSSRTGSLTYGIARLDVHPLDEFRVHDQGTDEELLVIIEHETGECPFGNLLIGENLRESYCYFLNYWFAFGYAERAVARSRGTYEERSA